MIVVCVLSSLMQKKGLLQSANIKCKLLFINNVNNMNYQIFEKQSYYKNDNNYKDNCIEHWCLY